MPKKPRPLSNPAENPDLSDADLDLISKLRPELAKQLQKIKDLTAQKIRLEAEAEGGFREKDPIHFLTKVLGWKPTPTALNYGITEPITPDQKLVMQSVRDNQFTAVPAGHGVGKTNIAAAIVLWFLYGMEDSIVITTAPTWELVEAQLWREIRQSYRNAKIPLAGRILQTSLEIGEKWYAKGLSTDESPKFTGFHSKRVLIIFDEATGVREELWPAGISMILGPKDRFLAIGNPTNPAARFKTMCESGRWNVIRMDCRNHPNVVHGNPEIIPGAVTRQWVEDRKEEYGGEDSPLFHARVAGFWPSQGQDSLISTVWVDAAQNWDTRKKIQAALAHHEVEAPAILKKRSSGMGVDIAGPGSDLCCAWECDDDRFRLLWWAVHRDLMETAGRIVRSIREADGRILACAIDDTGIGNGVSSRVLEVQRWAKADRALLRDDAIVNCSIIPVNFGEKSHFPDKFRRMRDQMWWQIRESLMNGKRGLPPESELLAHALPRGNSIVSQLVVPLYDQDSAGRIVVYDKRHGEMKKTLALPSKSPDLAHSLILTEHAYRSIRAETTAAPPKTLLEMRKQQFAEKIRALISPKQKDPEGPDIYKYL